MTARKGKKKGIAMLFSGGLDSTLEAVERLDEYEAVYLLTFNNGCCVNMGGARRRVEELRAAFGNDRIRYVEADTSPLRKRLLYQTGGELMRFKSPLVFDLACKMSGLMELIFHAKANGLEDITDGSSEEQTEIFLQDPEFAAHVKPSVSAYGLNFLRPLKFHMSRGEKMEQLAKHGLKKGTKALENIFITSSIIHQPFCLYGCVTFFFTSPLRHLGIIDRFALPMEKAMAAWDTVIPVAREHLDRRLRDAGALAQEGQG